MGVASRGRSEQWAIPWAPLGALALYLFLAALAQWEASHTGIALPLCHFRLLTGIPCPSCGATHAAFALLTGHVMDAWRFNPLLTCAYLVGPLWLILRYLTGRRVLIKPPARARWVAVGLLILAVAANWAYLIASEI